MGWGWEGRKKGGDGWRGRRGWGWEGRKEGGLR